MLETLSSAEAVFSTLAPNVQTAMVLFAASTAIGGLAAGLAISAIWRWARS